MRINSNTNWLPVGVVVFMIALAGCGAAQDGAANQTVEFDGSVVEQAAFERINEVRTARGLDPLENSAALKTNARSWSKTMAWEGQIFHADSDEFSCPTSGENVLYTYWRGDIDTDRGERYFDTSEELGRGIANQWLNSSQHRENILRERFGSAGIGVYMPDPDANAPRVYATQRFCG
jgi:uncharacterized protein YkwD